MIEQILTIRSPRIWDTNYEDSPNGYKKGFITNKYQINPDKKTIILESLTSAIELYRDLKKLWRDTDIIVYPFPMEMITPNCFQMIHEWKLTGIQYIVDAGWSENFGTDEQKNYILFKGLGSPFLPDTNLMVGRDPIIKYKKSKHGCHYLFRNFWSRPQVLRFNREDEGLWIVVDDQEHDVCMNQGFNFIGRSFQPVVYVPWPFYTMSYKEVEPIVKFQLDDRLFEI